MKAFATLLDRLTYTPSRLAKLKLMRNYFQDTPDPDRGYGLAALTDGLPFTFPLRRVLSELGETRFDPELFRLSRNDVGDTAETVALIWPVTGAQGEPPKLSDVVAALSSGSRSGHAALLTQWLDRLDATGRWALLKFLSGTPRVGVSARLAKQAVADTFEQSVDDVEELWHGLEPPYLPLFNWLEKKTDKPATSVTPVFRPIMLAHALEDAEWEALNLSDFAAEWKWDGIRIQASGKGGVTRLFSRTGDDIGGAFPELLDHFKFDGILDGELLVVRNGEVADFSDLQQRLNRKSVTQAMLAKYPAHVRFYDALELGGEDLRGLSFMARRKRLEEWHAKFGPPFSDLSELLSFESKEALRLRWEVTRHEGIEGLMLKRRESPYLAGRPKGHWFKWKRAALTADCVMLYAQKGSGKRSSFYSDYTFGAWTGTDGNRVLVPVGKAYSGFTDEELVKLDRFVRQHTVQRFGPVASVTPTLVMELAFDAVQVSARHKSGIAMRFPRVSRIRWDKPAAEADTLETLKALITAVR